MKTLEVVVRILKKSLASAPTRVRAYRVSANAGLKRIFGPWKPTVDEASEAFKAKLVRLNISLRFISDVNLSSKLAKP